jgi:hypothetical protein
MSSFDTEPLPPQTLKQQKLEEDLAAYWRDVVPHMLLESLHGEALGLD